MFFFDIIPTEITELILRSINDPTTFLGLYNSEILAITRILDGEHLQRLALLATKGRR